MSSSEDYLDQLLKGVMGDTPAENSNIVAANSTVQEQTFEEAVVEESVLQEPLVEETFVEETVLQEPSVDELTVEGPIIEEPIIEEPVIETPKPKKSRIAITDIPGLFDEPEQSSVDNSISFENDSVASDDESVSSVNSDVISANNDITTMDEDVASLMADIMPAFDAGLDSASENAAERIESAGDSYLNNFDFDSEIADVNGMIDETEAISANLNSLLDEINNFDVDNRINLDSFDDSVMEEPVLEEPIIEDSFVEEPLLEEPIIDESFVEEPVLEEPIIDESFVEEPLLEEPVIDESFAEEPVLEEPIIEDSFVEEPVLEEPIIDESFAEEPVLEEPIIDESFAEEPALEEPAQAMDFDLDSLKSDLIDAQLEEAEAEDLPDENDIERMLNQARNEGESTKGEEHVAPAEFDLDTLLETSNDANADEINELLGKAENNEAIDEGIAALLSGDSENLVPDFDNQEPELSPAEKKAKEKAEKAEAKRKAKEAKAEAKRKAKEEKAAAKLAKKKGVAPKANDVVDNPSDNNEFNEGISVNAEAGPVDDLSDVMSLLAGADVPLGDGEISEKHSAIPTNFTSDDGEVNITENSIGFDEFSGNDLDFNPIGDSLGGFEESFETQASEPNFDDIGLGNFDAEVVSGSDEATGEGGEDVSAKKGFLTKVKEFFSKIANAITDEDDDEDEIILSDENKQILDELDAEGVIPEKKKKAKKKKGKAKPSGEDGEGSDEAAPKPKKKKEKKPKKEKPAKDEKPDGKKISTKKIAMVVIACAMFAAVIFIITRLTGDFSVKMAGRAAYRNEDYQTCYQDLFGKDLNETETIMFNRSECILRIRLWYREYEIYAEEGNEVRALDSLIQSINSYPGLYTSAVNWGCLEKVEPTYNDMLNVLQNKYGLSADEAMAIAAEPDDVTYTRIVTAIAKGASYSDVMDRLNNPVIEDEEELIEPEEIINMSDKLPEEESINKENFIEP